MRKWAILNCGWRSIGFTQSASGKTCGLGTGYADVIIFQHVRGVRILKPTNSRDKSPEKSAQLTRQARRMQDSMGKDPPDKADLILPGFTREKKAKSYSTTVLFSLSSCPLNTQRLPCLENALRVRSRIEAWHRQSDDYGRPRIHDRRSPHRSPSADAACLYLVRLGLHAWAGHAQNFQPTGFSRVAEVPHGLKILEFAHQRASEGEWHSYDAWSFQRHFCYFCAHYRILGSGSIWSPSLMSPSLSYVGAISASNCPHVTHVGPISSCDLRKSQEPQESALQTMQPYVTSIP